ncbi:hypothetical protein F7R91_18430 [Streptomyces luteolifulvus]|uniref:Uncharacterized protein n=1 Tax=Streptomyces luteolifulvus TaxID=2615112 RepID=A0A6H9V1N9_9ACTN|nr:hypothetical protein [Streptomyces luteolifulvus]KAB1145699.1 hypothetical protein F7R91_18430 [Streptomyces luteolifulvus]
METGSAPRPGAVLGFGLVLMLVTGTLVAGCGESGTTGASTTGTTASASASATPPQDLCTRIVVHWSREVLDQNTYGDYQSMGLSNGQYEILRDVVDAARAEKKRRGAAAADELIDRRVREGCAELYRTGAPTAGPWQ